MFLLLTAFGVVNGCSGLARQRTISIGALEAAPVTSRASIQTRHGVLVDYQTVRSMCVPLTARFSLIQIHDSQDWETLASAAPSIGAPPTFVDGGVVGLVSRMGTPTAGGSPIAFRGARVAEGAGLISYTFAGGSYFPDGACYISLAHVPNLDAALVIEINGTRFYPQNGK